MQIIFFINFFLSCIKYSNLKAAHTNSKKMMLFKNKLSGEKKLTNKAIKPTNIKPNRQFSSKFLTSCELKIILLIKKPLNDKK